MFKDFTFYPGIIKTVKQGNTNPYLTIWEKAKKIKTAFSERISDAIAL